MSQLQVFNTKVAIVSIFMPFNSAVLFSLPNLQNNGHANIKGYTVILSALDVFTYLFHVFGTVCVVDSSICMSLLFFGCNY